ncbi:unnamed protein product [Amoebophrya sp. A25]|nr:unnamed protein product [Amoebophrya sp. A25]|eukprot:GSA25T00012181001.1
MMFQNFSSLKLGDFHSFAKETAQKAREAAEKAAEQTAIKAKEAREAAQNAVQVVQDEYRATFEEQLTSIYDVIPKRLLIMEYPSPDKIARLANRLNRLYQDKYLVLNMSEHGYEAREFRGEVMDIRFRGLPSPPLELFFKLVISVKQWLDTSPENVAVVHCFSGYTRSAMFCACYLYWSAYCQTTQRGLEYTLRRVKVKESNILPTQKRYMEYFEQVMADGARVSPCKKYLTRVLITGIPNFLDPVVAQQPGTFAPAGRVSSGVGAAEQVSTKSASPLTATASATGAASSDQLSKVAASTSAVVQPGDAAAAWSATSGAATTSSASAPPPPPADQTTASGEGGGTSSSSNSSPPPPPPPPPTGSSGNASSFGDMFSSFSATMRTSSKDAASQKLLSFGKEVSAISKDFSQSFKSFAQSSTLTEGFQRLAAGGTTATTSSGSEIKESGVTTNTVRGGTGTTAAGTPVEQQTASSAIDDAASSDSEEKKKEPIFVPYLEIWHKEKLLFSSWNSLNPKTSPSREYFASDTCVPFALKDDGKYLCPPLDGDVLLRVRHFDKRNRAKSSAFRLGFNTNYVSSNFLHFPNSELDTATIEFPADGFVDLFFEDANEENGGETKSAGNIEKEGAVFERAKQLFDEIREKEAELLRKQVLEDKENRLRSAGKGAGSAGGGSSENGSIEERMQTEEEFDRLQRQLIDLDSPSGGGAAVANGDVVDVDALYGMDDAAWRMEGPAGSAPSSASKNRGTSNRSDHSNSTTSLKDSLRAVAETKNVAVVDMTTPKSDEGGPPTTPSGVTAGADNIDFSKANKQDEKETAAPPPPPAVTQPPPPATTTTTKNTTSTGGASEPSAPPAAQTPPATSSATSGSSDGGADLLSDLLERKTVEVSAAPGPADKKAASPAADDLLDSLMQAGPEDKAKKDEQEEDELDDLLTMI